MPKQMIGKIKVHTFRLPPKGFDPLSASPRELKRYGFPRRPDAVQMPTAAAKWVIAFREYYKFEHITPRFELLKLRHGPNQRIGKKTEGIVNATSYNWSGSELIIGSGDRFNAISGSWTVPHVYHAPGFPGTQYSSAWLGIDNSQDILQVGTETDSDGSCYAWHEWYPESAIKITKFPVHPGDVMLLLLCALSPTQAQVVMANKTSRLFISFGFSAPGIIKLVGNSAEAIVERPSVFGVMAELPRYGEVFFDDTTAYSEKEIAYNIGLGTPWSMVADDGVTVISAPTFEADTDAFKVSYLGP